jgi:hypothetical protein
MVIVQQLCEFVSYLFAVRRHYLLEQKLLKVMRQARPEGHCGLSECLNDLFFRLYHVISCQSAPSRRHLLMIARG